MAEKFKKQALDSFNNFRKKPISVKDDLEKIRRAFTRFPGFEKLKEELEKIIKKLPTIKPMPPFEVKEPLNELASQELQKYLKDDDQIGRFVNGKDLNGVLADDLEDDDCVLIADDTEDPTCLASKILINKPDKYAIGRNAIINPEFVEVGIAATKEGAFAVIFAKKSVLSEPKQKKVEEEEEIMDTDYDLTELKEAFDLFDYGHTGYIDSEEVVDFLKKIGYPDTEAEVYKIMRDLNDEKGNKVSFPKFVNFILNTIANFDEKQNLKKMFDLYVDDPVNKTISAIEMHHLCKELNEPESLEKIKEILYAPGGVKKVLTFDEFYEFIKNIPSDKLKKSEEKETEKYKARTIPANKAKEEKPKKAKEEKLKKSKEKEIIEEEKVVIKKKVVRKKK